MLATAGGGMRVQSEADRERSGFGHWAALVAIVAAGAVLRTVSIDAEALWGDEALSLVLAHWPVAEMALRPSDPTPFLYYGIHKLLLGGDVSAAAARSISLACGLAAIPLVYAAGRLCFGRTAALAAAALLAVWGPHIDYSQEARAYALLFLLTLASATALLWWFAEAVREEQRRIAGAPSRRIALACFALTTSLSFYTHLTAIFWIALALQILISVTMRTEARRYLREAGAALVAMALLAMPGLVRLTREMAAPDAFHWLAQAGPAEFAATAADILLPFGGGGLATPLQIAAGAALLFLLVARRAALRSLFARNAAAAPVILALLALPLIVWLAGYALRPIFMPRTALYGAPGAILLIAGALRLLSGRAFAAGAAGAVALAFSQPLLIGTVRDKEDWRGAVAALGARVRPGDLVIACPSWKFPALRHAAARPLPAPVVLPFGEMLAIEPSLGGEERWDRIFFEAVTAPMARDLHGGPRRGPYPRSTVSLARSARIWLVASECAPDEMRGIAEWLGARPRWTRVWSSRGDSGHAAIEVTAYAPGRPLSLPVRLPR